MIKNIGFYGHSNCAYTGEGSLIDLVANHFQSNIVNIGVRQGSEERVLFELKKTKQLDLAIIFHCKSEFIFIPNADRDISSKLIDESRANYLFDNFNNQHHQEHHKKFTELFKTPDELITAINYLRSYFYHPDLQLNRFYGALLQIDQYITTKQIPTIHVIIKNSLPSWFKFTSGIVNESIINIFDDHKLNPNEWFYNCTTKQGNGLVANELIKLIETIK